MMENSSPVVLIGLDAASPDLIEKWIDDNTLPNLKRLRKRGSFVRIGSKEDLVIELPWVTFYTGVNQGKHGAYHYLHWIPEKMSVERVSKDILPIIPFWHKFESADPKTIIIDIPHNPMPEKLNGLEINGWDVHDLLESRNSYPRDLLKTISKSIKQPKRTIEQYKLFSTNELIGLKNEILNEIESKIQLVKFLSKKTNWDLLMVVFSAPHISGHKFWDTTNLESRDSGNDNMELTNALKQIYIACDQALGRLLDLLPINATYLVCSLHGMGANQSRGIVLPEILEKILNKDSKSSSSKPNFLSSLRMKIPADFRHRIKEQLPIPLQDRLSAFWRMGRMKSTKSSAFVLPYDYNAYVQVNLIGREKYGVVSPGEEYENLINKISRGITSFRDADTDEPIVDKILRREELGLEGEYLEKFPDLTIRWKHTPAANHRALHSNKYGTIPWPTPGRIPEGRSGEHRYQGFLIAVGEKFPPNAFLDGMRIVDLAPTILDLLGLKKLPEMEGYSIVP